MFLFLLSLFLVPISLIGVFVLLFVYVYYPWKISQERSLVTHVKTGEHVPVSPQLKPPFGDLIAQFADYKGWVYSTIKILAEKGMMLGCSFDIWLIFLNDPKLIAEVHGKPEENYSREIMRGTFKRLTGSSILGASGEDWSRQHRLLQKAFTPIAIPRFFGMMLSSTEALFQKIDHQMKTTGQVPIHLLLMDLTYDCIVKAIFASDAEQTKRIIECFLNIRQSFPDLRWRLPYYEKLNFIPSVKKVNDSFEELHDICRAIMKERRKYSAESEGTSNSERMKSLIDLFLEARDEETNTPLPDQEIIDNVCIFLFVGSETTANALAWMLHHLMCNPTIYEQLQPEIDEVFPEDLSTLTYNHLSKLKFFNQVMNETMRLTPAVPVCAPRILKQPRQIGDWSCKTDTSLCAQIFATHLSPLNYQEPEMFLPERWDGEELDKQRTEEDIVRDAKFIPFGIGSRLCIGKYFALMEIRVILGTLLKKFKVSVPSSEKLPKRGVIGGPILRLDGGLNLCFERR